MTVLEDLLTHPVGEDPVVCSWKGVPADELPVLGQEHRVVVTGMPPGHTSPGRAFLRTLKELQEDYPDAIVHLHGPYSWNVAFGTGMKSADVEPRTSAAKGRVTLPMGSDMPYEKTFTKAQWTRAVGFEPAELAIPRNRCMFNIKSASWAADNYAELFKFRTRRSRSLDIDIRTPKRAYTKSETKRAINGKTEPTPADKFICNTCSLMDKCKFFRDGAVCSVPGAEPIPLTQFFGTRDSGLILDGLAILIKSGITRYERGLGDEAVTGELLPEVTKIQTQLFDQGVKLAKLVDPNLRGGPKVEVNVGRGSAVQVNNGNPRQVIAAAIRELEARGVAREDITPEMIQNVFEGMTSPEKVTEAIEATVVSSRLDEE
jgi:hypothetical protein